MTVNLELPSHNPDREVPEFHLSDFEYLVRYEYPAFVDRRAGPLDELSGRDRQLLAAMGLSGEAGEVSELYKKMVLLKSKPFDRDRLVDEMGDVFWYFVLMMNVEDITLKEIIDTNIKKLNERYGENG